MLRTLQPSSGGYLEATPLTSFVTMALASADEKHHPCVPDRGRLPPPLPARGRQLGHRYQSRHVGHHPLNRRRSTGARTLSECRAPEAAKPRNHSTRTNAPALPSSTWLLSQQYREVHPFTNAAPGGWAWTDLPGGVPDADDTSGALIALWHLSESDDERRAILPSIEAGITWLLDLQNRDGGMPTFCRGWGALALRPQHAGDHGARALGFREMA